MMPDTPEILKFLAPFVKGEDGNTMIVLSDSSIDRQNERISSLLIRKWAEVERLPALVDHKHSIDSIVAVWKNIKAVEMGGNVALIAEPDWLDDDYAQKIRRKVEQLVEKGLRVGVSIGAVPKESQIVEDGVREWTDAELVEASFVAIPANPNAGVWQASLDLAKSMKEEENMDDKTLSLLKEILERVEKIEKAVEELNVVEEDAVQKSVIPVVEKESEDVVVYTPVKKG